MTTRRMATAPSDLNLPEKSALANLNQRINVLETELARMRKSGGVTLLVFSGELDKLMAAFNIANAAAASGIKVTMFFTFWGAAALKKKTVLKKKSIVECAFGFLLPGGLHKRRLSHMDFAGFGRSLMGAEMRKKRVDELPKMVDLAGQLGVEMLVCEMSMNLMGITSNELIDYPNRKFCGATKFIALANNADTTLFV